MKKNRSAIIIIVFCSLMVNALLLSGNVWAAGVTADGSSSPGGGSTFSNPCSGASTIISTDCGDNGGGKSWRIYKVNSKTKTVKALNKLNSKAKWKVDNSNWNGASITNLLKQCAEGGFPYVMLFGFNRVSTSDGVKKFYVMFNRTAPSNNCNNNRGCYYEWNNTDALTSASAVRKAKKKGQAVKGTNSESTDVAYELYKDEWSKSWNDFKKVGGFCTRAGETKTLTAYAVRTDGTSLNGGNSIDEDTVEAGETAWVFADRPAASDTESYAYGHKFQCWSKARNCNSGNVIVSEDPEDTDDASDDQLIYTVNSLTADKTVYAVYKADDVTLSGVAVDKNGTAIGTSCNPDPKTVSFGSSATIYSKTCSGYTPKGWSSSRYGTPTGSVSSYTESNLQANKTVYIIYEKDAFQGKSTVTYGSSSASTGYVNANGTSRTLELSGCENGCTVSFSHYLKRTAGGNYQTKYKIERITAGGTSTVVDFRDSSITSNNTETVVRTNATATIRRDEYVCERLWFRPEVAAKAIYIQVCAVATGAMTSPGNISIQVRDISSSTQYRSWTNEAYAKPGDKVDYLGTFNPGTVQTEYNHSAYKMKCTGLVNLTYTNVSALGDKCSWNNGFSLLIKNTWRKDSTKAKGNTGTQTLQDTYVSTTTAVRDSDVGTEILGKALTNYGTGGKGARYTPTSVSWSTENVTETVSSPDGQSMQIQVPKPVANVEMTEQSATVSAYVPYNFIVTTEITTPGPGEEGTPKMYVGENMPEFQTETKIDKKENRLTTLSPTTQKYSTMAKDVTRKLIVYYPRSDSEVKEGGVASGGRNANLCSSYMQIADSDKCYYSNVITGNLNPDSTNNDKFSFNTQDVPAGMKMCVASAVFPATSGEDGNWNDTNYDVSWRISESKCYKLAKRPSLQVLGGNVYTTGSIKTGLSVKQVLYGSNNSKKPYVFGSWGELGVISAGQVTGFASGASIGYKTNSNGTLWPDPQSNADGTNLGSDYPGGWHGESSLCKLSPLTVSNVCKSSNTVSGIGSADSVKDTSDDKTVLKNMVTNGDYRNIGGSEISIDGFNDDGNIRYKKSGNLTVNESTLTSDTFKLIYASGDVLINGDIKADKNATMKTFDQAPKMVIYSDGNIKISCNVSRVDAVLVSEKTVTTCDPGFELDKSLDEDVDFYNDNINLKVFSKQLQVNGAIVAKSLEPNRTYGAARGINSMLSAEIINFDPTLLLWGGAAQEKKDGGTNNDNPLSGDLVTTYIHELAPRY